MGQAEVTTEFKVGDHVRIERDEVLHPSKGTWPRHRGQTGFICVINKGGGAFINDEWTDEFGVVLTTTRPRWRQDEGHEGELSYDSDAIKWFRDFEMRVIPG